MANVLETAAEAIAGPWGVLIVALTPTALSGLFLAYKWWTDRRDKLATEELSEEEREVLRLERERQSLSAGQQQLFATVSAENERLRLEIKGVRDDRDRGWTFARRCETRMHQLYHMLLNARQMVDGDRERAGAPAVAWPEIAALPTDQETHV